MLGQGRFDELLEQGLLHICEGEVRVIHIPGNFDLKSELRRRHEIVKSVSLDCRVQCISVRDRFYRDAHDLHNVFQKMDSNGDKELSEFEVSEYYRNHHTSGTVPGGFWQHEDKDNNTIISFEEFSGPKGLTAADDPLHLSGNSLEPVPHTLNVNEHHFRRARRSVDGAHGQYHKHRGRNRDEL